MAAETLLAPSLRSLAQAEYIPFLSPLPVWDYWYVLLIPLCLAVSIVYKSIKCRSMSTVPREALSIFLAILVGMGAAAVALAGVVWAVER